MKPRTRNSAKIAPQILKAMTYQREEYKNKIQSHLTGAIIAFYKVRLAKKNGQTRWVAHWMTEVKSLIEHQLVYEILHAIRGFRDRRQAYEQAVKEFQANDSSYRRYAATIVKKDFKLVTLKHALDDTDTAAFWEYVQGFADAALAAAE